MWSLSPYIDAAATVLAGLWATHLAGGTRNCPAHRMPRMPNSGVPSAALVRC
jgi:hypothetical protein